MKFNVLLTADWHLSDQCPPCRKDDWWAAQAHYLQEVSKFSVRHKCLAVLHAGDMFDETYRNRYRPSPRLLSLALQHMPKNVITIPGNHDLPEHDLGQYESSGLAALETAGVVTVLRLGEVIHLEHTDGTGLAPVARLRGFPWGTEEDWKHWVDPPGDMHTWTRGDRGTRPGKKVGHDLPEVVLAHHLTWDETPPFPGAPNGSEAARVSKAFPKATLVVTGDNHQYCFYASQDRKTGRPLPTVVNPGSLMRLRANQLEDTARIVVVSLDSEDPTFLRLQICNPDTSRDVLTREHRDVPQEREDRLNAFVESLQDGTEVHLGFEDNLRQAMAKAPAAVRDMVARSLQEER